MRANLGCGPVAPDGWVNVDSAVGARIANHTLARAVAKRLRLLRLDWPKGIVLHDLRNPLPWPDASVVAVYSSHVLEHLTREDAARLLKETYRVLKPGGTLRIVVPDLGSVVSAYVEGRILGDEFLESLSVLRTDDGDGFLKRRFAPHFRFPHRCMYDEEALLRVVTNAGFAARVARPFESDISDIRVIEREAQTRGAVIVEGTRPTIQLQPLA